MCKTLISIAMALTVMFTWPVQAKEVEMSAATTVSRSALIAFSASADLTRARHFFHDVLGLAVLEENAMVIVFDVLGTQLRVSKVDKPVVAPYTVLGFQVKDIKAAVAELNIHGIAFEKFPGLPQDTDAIATFGNGDRVAWFKDPDGHILSLTHFSR